MTEQSNRIQDLERLSDRSFLTIHKNGVLWLTVLASLFLSSLLFACLFEWGRYHLIADPMTHIMSLRDKGLLLWFLVAKSVILFLPILLICGLLIGLKLGRISAVIFNLFWIVIFAFMTADLVAVSFVGCHAWEYLLDTDGTLRNAWVQFRALIGERASIEIFFLVSVFAISGPVFFFAMRWVAIKLLARFRWLVSGSSLAVFTLALLPCLLGIVPEQTLFRDRIYDTLPLPPSLRNSFDNLTDNLATLVGINHSCSSDLTFQNGGYQNQNMVRIRSDEVAANKLLREALNPTQPDPFALVNRQELPNVLLVVVESFRYHSVGNNLLRELDAFSKRGLRLHQHYSGSNSTNGGLFSIFFSRVPLGYHQTLDNKIAPQMVESLKRSGYEITFINTGEVKNYGRLGEWISGSFCDNFIEEGKFSLWQKHMNDWPNADRRKLADVQKIVNDKHDRPQFVFVFLVSSHWNYVFPPEYEIFPNIRSLWQYLNAEVHIQKHVNRYANSVLFLEHELMKLVRSIDLNRNIIMITGDHGESMKEDGVFTHGSRMSDIQMRVPFIMVGPGVESKQINSATAHYDILPTLLHVLAGSRVPVIGSNGRDLIANPSLDEPVVVTPRIQPITNKLLFIHDDERLLFSTEEMSAKSPVMEFAGLLDEAGQYKFKVKLGGNLNSTSR